MPLGFEDRRQIVDAVQSIWVVLAQLGLPWARQHRRIAQIASLHKRRNWKSTMAHKQPIVRVKSYVYTVRPIKNTPRRPVVLTEDGEAR